MGQILWDIQHSKLLREVELRSEFNEAVKLDYCPCPIIDAREGNPFIDGSMWPPQ